MGIIKHDEAAIWTYKSNVCINKGMEIHRVQRSLILLITTVDGDVEYRCEVKFTTNTFSVALKSDIFARKKSLYYQSIASIIHKVFTNYSQN